VAGYIEATRRKVMIEYLLLDGINDSPEDAKKLIILLKRSLRHLYYVNLITYNPTGKYRSPPRNRIEKFQKALEEVRHHRNSPSPFRPGDQGRLRAVSGRVTGEFQAFISR